MLTAALYGLAASSGLLIGAIIGLVTAPSRRTVAGIIAFGSGVLVSALTFELMEEAFAEGSPASVRSWRRIWRLVASFCYWSPFLPMTTVII